MRGGANFEGVTFFTPAATVTAANNGTSLSGTTVVLGNDVADLTRPAQLLNNRVIPVSDVASGGAFYFSIQDWALDSEMRIDGSRLEYNANAHADLVYYFGNLWQVSVGGIVGLQDAGAIDTSTGNWQIGSAFAATNIGVFNGARLQVNGSVTYKLFNAPISGNYNFDLDQDNAKHFYNPNGLAANILLPNTALAGRNGTQLYVSNDNAAGITVTAGNQVIRMGALVSTAGGTINSVVAGSAVHLVLQDPNTFVAMSYTGVWTLT